MDYNEIGRKLYELRVAADLSQKELAEQLGITNKAVSKWENGNALPSLNQLINLSKIFNVSMDEMIKVNDDQNKLIKKIVITGGPCSGKSTAISWLQNKFTKKGYMVLFIPEAATELILGGVSKWTIDTNLNFESYIVKLQLEKERIFEEAAKQIALFNKVLIICDRGVIDCKAYSTPLEFRQILKGLNVNEVALRDSYDAVFHLVTAAKGAEEFYTIENNKARQESLEEAIISDEKTLNSWMGHPHLRVIDNSTDFENKMKRLMSEISDFLGESESYEIERKFLIEYPNLQLLEKMPNCQKVEIIQTYLKSKDGAEIRIRQRGLKDGYIYTKTIKKNINGLKRIETERRISKDQYLSLMLDADTTKRQIRKTRYCLMHKNQYFEIDVYPQWKDKAILELEVKNENQKIEFPKVINVIKEVTGDKEFLNSSIASQII